MQKNIYLRYVVICVSMILLSTFWEFWLEDNIFSIVNPEQEQENVSEKVEYIMTIAVFCLISLLLPLQSALRSEKERRKEATDRERLISNLQIAMSEIKQLKGIIPICASCKKIRDDHGYWEQIETYLHKHSEAAFSHGICPTCAKRLYPDLDIDHYRENLDHMPI